MLSMRYTTWAAVCSGRMHVVETHKSELGLHLPPMPKTDFILKKLRPCLAKEKPEGRKLRPGLGNIQVSAICQSLLASVNCSVEITTFFRPRVLAGQPAEVDSDL